MGRRRGAGSAAYIRPPDISPPHPRPLRLAGFFLRGWPPPAPRDVSMAVGVIPNVLTSADTIGIVTPSPPHRGDGDDDATRHPHPRHRMP